MLKRYLHTDSQRIPTPIITGCLVVETIKEENLLLNKGYRLFMGPLLSLATECRPEICFAAKAHLRFTKILILFTCKQHIEFYATKRNNVSLKSEKKKT
jgi:hypothetical protein